MGDAGGEPGDRFTGNSQLEILEEWPAGWTSLFGLGNQVLPARACGRHLAHCSAFLDRRGRIARWSERLRGSLSLGERGLIGAAPPASWWLRQRSSAMNRPAFGQSFLPSSNLGAAPPSSRTYFRSALPCLL